MSTILLSSLSLSAHLMCTKILPENENSADQYMIIRFTLLATSLPPSWFHLMKEVQHINNSSSFPPLPIMLDKSLVSVLQFLRYIIRREHSLLARCFLLPLSQSEKFNHSSKSGAKMYLWKTACQFNENLSAPESCLEAFKRFMFTSSTSTP